MIRKDDLQGEFVLRPLRKQEMRNDFAPGSGAGAAGFHSVAPQPRRLRDPQSIPAGQAGSKKRSGRPGQPRKRGISAPKSGGNSFSFVFLSINMHHPVLKIL